MTIFETLFLVKKFKGRMQVKGQLLVLQGGYWNCEKSGHIMRNCINPKTIEVDSINTTTEEVHKALILVVYSLLDD